MMMKKLAHRLAAPMAALTLTLAAAIPADAQLSRPLSAEQLMASHLAMQSRVAMQTAGGEVRESQFVVARTLLDQALELDPRDAGLWRLRAEVAQRMEDPQARERALGEYLRLEPDDEAAQLQLILLKIEGFEQLDDRLDLIDRILNNQRGKQLSEPIRSRLATRAAAMARELGNDAAFARWLRVALKHDDVNAAAARLLLEFVLEKNGSNQKIGTAAINVIEAAPLDLGARLRLASVLTQEGKHDLALEQYDTATRLAGALLPPEQFAPYMRSLASAGRADEAIQQMDHYLNVMKQMRLIQEQAAAEGQADPPPEGPVELPVEVELVRLAILSTPVQPGAGQAVRGGGSFRPIKRELLALADEGHDQLRFDYLWIGAMLGHDLDAIRAATAELPPEEPTTQLLQGLLAMRDGQIDRAASLLGPLSEIDPIARFGMALLMDDRPAMQISSLEALTIEPDAGLIPLLATLQAIDSGGEPRVSTTGVALARIMGKSPNALWKLDLRNNPWVDVNLDLEPAQFYYAQPIPAQITIRNISTQPMAVGPSDTLPGLSIIQAVATAQGQAVGRSGPMVTDVARKLRLEPGESVSAVERLDQHVIGRILSQGSFGTISLNATLIYAPTSGPQGGIITGPMGGTDTVQAVQVSGAPVTPGNIERWLGAVNSPDRVEQMLALSRLVRLTGQIPEDLQKVATNDDIAAAINEQYPVLNPIAQAWVVQTLASSQFKDEYFERILEVAQRSEDPLIRKVYLVSHVLDPEDASLAAATRSSDPVLREFAEAQRAEIEEFLRMQEEAERLQREAEEAAEEGNE